MLQIILGTPEIATLLDLLDDLRGNSVLEKGVFEVEGFSEEGVHVGAANVEAAGVFEGIGAI